MSKVRPTTKRQRLKLHKIPFIAYLDPEQKQALVKLSRRTGVPQSHYVRMGIDWILNTQPAQLAPSLQSTPPPLPPAPVSSI